MLICWVLDFIAILPHLQHVRQLFAPFYGGMCPCVRSSDASVIQLLNILVPGHMWQKSSAVLGDEPEFDTDNEFDTFAAAACNRHRNLGLSDCLFEELQMAAVMMSNSLLVSNSGSLLAKFLCRHSSWKWSGVWPHNTCQSLVCANIVTQQHYKLEQDFTAGQAFSGKCVRILPAKPNSWWFQRILDTCFYLCRKIPIIWFFLFFLLSGLSKNWKSGT